MILRIKKARHQILIGMALVLAIFAGAWFFAQMNTAIPAHVAGWETFRNDDLGYEIQYPPGWKIKTYPSFVGKTAHDDALVFFSSPINSGSYSRGNLKGNDSTLYLSVSNPSENADSKKLLENTYFDRQIATNTLRSMVVVTYNDKIYALVGDSSGEDYVASQMVIDQMLSTFKLLK